MRPVSEIRPGNKPMCTGIGADKHVWNQYSNIGCGEPIHVSWWAKRFRCHEGCYCMRCGAEAIVDTSSEVSAVREALFAFVVLPSIFFAIVSAGVALLVRCGIPGAT